MYAPVFTAIKDFFKRPTWGGIGVMTVFAGPDRAHTEARKEVAKRMKGKKTRLQIENAAIPVPFLSVWYTEPKYDASRDSRAKIRGFAKNRVTGTAKSMRYPRPMVADIQVDLWCGEAGHLIAQSIEAQVELAFPHDSVYLPVDWGLEKWYHPPFNVSEHARVLGRTRVTLIGEGWQDTSNLETGSDPKEVRRTWSGRAEFYIPYRPEEERLVRTLDLVVLDATVDPPEIIESQISGVED